MRVEKAEDQVTADIVRPGGQLWRLLEQLSHPTIRSAICGCSSISWIKNYRWLNSSGGVPESDLQLTDSSRDKPCDSASESFLSCVTTPCNPDLAVFY